MDASCLFPLEDSRLEVPLGMGMWGAPVSMATASDLSRGMLSTGGHMVVKASCVVVVCMGFWYEVVEGCKLMKVEIDFN